MGFKEWLVGQVMMPDNFKQILDSCPAPPGTSPTSGVKVICLGLSRTGTSSIKAALNTLHFRTFHAMDFLQQINNEESFNFWKSLKDGNATEEEIRSYFAVGNYGAVCDVPCLIYWRDIVRAHPGAKIILTVRDPSKWYRSLSTTLIPLAKQLNRWLWLNKLVLFLLSGKYFQAEHLQILFQQFHDKQLQEESKAVQFYHDWNTTISASIPPSNLLVFDVRSGWGPLCQFLDCPQPATSFPRLNDSSELVKHQKYVSFFVTITLLVLFGICGIFIIIPILLFVYL